MRLRQVALVATDFEAPKADLTETVGIEVAYRDRATAEARGLRHGAQTVTICATVFNLAQTRAGQLRSPSAGPGLPGGPGRPLGSTNIIGNAPGTAKQRP